MCQRVQEYLIRAIQNTCPQPRSACTSDFDLRRQIDFESSSDSCLYHQHALPKGTQPHSGVLYLLSSSLCLQSARKSCDKREAEHLNIYYENTRLRKSL